MTNHIHFKLGKGPELDPDPSGRVKVTAVVYYSPERLNYTTVYDEETKADRERTVEELNALTIEAMMAEDEKNLKEGAFSLEELMSWEAKDPDVTFEVES